MDLRVLKVRTYAVGVFLMTVLGFVLYGSLVLLPLMLQTLLGYPSLQAGIALAPRGMGSFIAMPLVGAMMGRIDARKLLAAGLFVGSCTLFWLGSLNRSLGYWDIFWPQFIQGLALGLLFVPLTTITMDSIPRENMGNATSIFNLMRNIGGSMGIAAATTLLARHRQEHSSNLASHVDAFNPQVRAHLRSAEGGVPGAGRRRRDGHGARAARALRHGAARGDDAVLHRHLPLAVADVPGDAAAAAADAQPRGAAAGPRAARTSGPVRPEAVSRGPSYRAGGPRSATGRHRLAVRHGAEPLRRRLRRCHLSQGVTMLSLKSVRDEDLLCQLLELVKESRGVEAEIVARIGEVELRRLYAQAACSSMFEYCRRILCLRENEAYLRITVARAAREHPVLLDMLCDGRLHLSGIARLAPHLTRENAEAVLNRACGMSHREIRELVAELEPRPDVTPERPQASGASWVGQRESPATRGAPS